MPSCSSNLVHSVTWRHSILRGEVLCLFSFYCSFLCHASSQIANGMEWRLLFHFPGTVTCKTRTNSYGSLTQFKNRGEKCAAVPWGCPQEFSVYIDCFRGNSSKNPVPFLQVIKMSACLREWIALWRNRAELPTLINSWDLASNALEPEAWGQESCATE